jgi:hypothetical protein
MAVFDGWVIPFSARDRAAIAATRMQGSRAGKVLLQILPGHCLTSTAHSLHFTTPVSIRPITHSPRVPSTVDAW